MATAGRAAPGGQPRSTIPFWIAALAIAATGFCLELRRAPAFIAPDAVLFDDPDDHLRVHRARTMLETGRVRIRRMPEINHPLGAELHWTSPPDWLLAGVFAAFGPVTDHPDRFGYIALWPPLVFGAAYSLLMIDLVRRLGGPAAGLFAGALAVLSPAFHRVFQLGHPDHHFLLEFLYLLAIRLWLPGVRRAGGGPSLVACASSGAVIGLAIWIATHAMLVWACLLAGATVATFHASPEDRATWRDRRMVWTGGVLVVAAIGWLIENWPDCGGVAIDKISLLHVAIIAATLWVPDGAAADPAERRRSLSAAGVLAALLGAWLVLDRHRVLEFVSRPEFHRWSALVAELQPLFVRTASDWSLAPLHGHLGYFPYALPMALIFFARSKSANCQLKTTLGLLALVMTGAAILQRRWLDHVCVGLIPVTVLGLQEMLHRLTSRWSGRSLPLPGGVLGWRFPRRENPRSCENPLSHAPSVGIPSRDADPALQAEQHPKGSRVRAITLAFLLALLSWPCAAFVLKSPPDQPSVHLLRTHAAAARIRQYEQQHPSPAGRSRAILCEDGDGPALLHLTRLPIVASPYHRALDGLVEAAEFYAQRDPARARAQLDRLGVGYVVVPYRPHEQLANFETIAFGAPRSYDPPERNIDERGELREKLRYRPEVRETMAYRLALEEGGAIAGLQSLAQVREGAATADGYSGLLYAVGPP